MVVAYAGLCKRGILCSWASNFSGLQALDHPFNYIHLNEFISLFRAEHAEHPDSPAPYASHLFKRTDSLL